MPVVPIPASLRRHHESQRGTASARLREQLRTLEADIAAEEATLRGQIERDKLLHPEISTPIVEDGDLPDPSSAKSPAEQARARWAVEEHRIEVMRNDAQSLRERIARAEEQEKRDRRMAGDAPIDPVDTPAVSVVRDTWKVDAEPSVIDARVAFDKAIADHGHAEAVYAGDRTDGRWSKVKAAAEARDKAEAVWKRARSDADHAHTVAEQKRVAEVRAKADEHRERASVGHVLEQLGPLAVRAIRAQRELEAVRVELDMIMRAQSGDVREAKRLYSSIGDTSTDVGHALGDVPWIANALADDRARRGIEPREGPLPASVAWSSASTRSSQYLAAALDAWIREVG